MIFLACVFFAFSTFAQNLSESWQLQQLIMRSEQQITLLKEIIHDSNRDSQALQKVSQSLTELTNGIDVSIEKYQGTPEYEEALSQLQVKNNFERTYKDFWDLKKKNGAPDDDEIEFQKQTVRANRADLARQRALGEALATAPHGLVAKIQAESQIGEWQASTRISVQLTELLAALRSVREELRGRENAPSAEVLNQLLRGAEAQSEKLRSKERP